jgi:hypothetical protein
VGLAVGEARRGRRRTRDPRPRYRVVAGVCGGRV